MAALKGRQKTRPAALKKSGRLMAPGFLTNAAANVAMAPTVFIASSTPRSTNPQVKETLMADITLYKLDAAFAPLSKFDHLAKPDDFIEVSLWHNGEGFDAHLSSHAEQTIRLSWGEFKALKKLIKELDQ
jgi:hypothetical protein